MAPPKDKKWLTDALAKHLGWDTMIAGEVVNALANANSSSERNEIIEGYIGGNAKAKQLIAEFFEAAQPEKKSTGRNMLSGREIERGRRVGGSVTVRHVPSRQATPSHTPAGPLVEREVCNCLCCGKIYLTRNDTEDVKAFLNSGGKCTFCGAQISLLLNGRSETRAQHRSHATPLATPVATSSDQGASLEAAERDQQAAEAFKDRLVDYDRNARKRTTVVDDQNDFFEIDTNAWLDPEERAQLKRQEQAMAEAEEARKRRVTVTVDLLGRQVILADDQEASEEAVRFREAATAAAMATAKEGPQGGGMGAKPALETASKIRPNLTSTAQRPMFVQTQPETHAERQIRRGLHPQQNAEDLAETSQGVVGGWGDERASSGGVDRLGARSSNDLPPGLHGGAGNSSSLSAGHRSAVAKMVKGRTSKQAKRPQLNRLQHDDPFEALTMTALDAY